METLASKKVAGLQRSSLALFVLNYSSLGTESPAVHEGLHIN
jgi:hypothetical protein